MLCKNKNPEKIESMASILILGGVIPLLGALLSQYGFNFKPCHFCLLQRYPYVLVVALGVLSLFVTRGALTWRFIVATSIYALLATATLGAIHTGIENAFLAYTGGCVADSTATSLEAIRAAIANAPLVSCNDRSFVFLNLSMATWNVIWALCVILLAALQYRFDVNRYDHRIAL